MRNLDVIIEQNESYVQNVRGRGRNDKSFNFRDGWGWGCELWNLRPREKITTESWRINIFPAELFQNLDSILLDSANFPIIKIEAVY